MKKYELIPEGKLFRIIALKDFNGVKKGYFGGVVENRNNLGQQGNCWIHENAKVTGNAKATKEVITFGNIFDYDITITDNHIKIGCQQYLKSRWLEFTNKEILEMEGKRALKFWGLFKPFAINTGFFN